MPLTVSQHYLAAFGQVLKPGRIGYFELTEHSPEPGAAVSDDRCKKILVR
jgi:hypothetical protein